jgi:tripartite-type tricarboxylate transporter receptor subunit TctC
MKCALIALLSLAALSLPANSQDYPTSPVKVIVPTNPGGSIDISARVSMQALEKIWGKPVVIENRPGASMIIGTETVKSAKPDGYTFLVTHDGTMAMNPYIFPNLSYKPTTDLTPIALLAEIPGALFVNLDSSVNSVQGLIDAVKANPSKWNHASGGPATLLWSELFKSMTRVNYNEVNYQGAAQAINSLAMGETQLVFTDLASGSAALQGKRVRLLAVTTPERSPAYPDVPTIAETIKGYEAITWIGMFGPPGLPQALAEKVSGDVAKALQTDQAKQSLERVSMIVKGQGGGSELSKTLAKDLEKWGALIQKEGIKFGQ